MLTLYISNRAFEILRKFSSIYKHRKIVDLLLKNELKTKYNILDQYKPEFNAFYCPTIYKTLNEISPSLFLIKNILIMLSTNDRLTRLLSIVDYSFVKLTKGQRQVSRFW